MDRLYIPVIALHLSIVAKKTHSIATITQLRSLELLIKTPLLHMLYYINWLTYDFWTRTGGWQLDRSHGAGTSSPSHSQQVEEQAPKHVGWAMCFLLMTLVPVQKLCIYIYICMHSCYRTYIYNGSVIQYWRSCTPRAVFVLNNTLILGLWCSTIPHLLGCFCPWTFFENIGFNTVLKDPFMSHLATQLGYSAGEFQALQLIVLRAFGVVD